MERLEAIIRTGNPTQKEAAKRCVEKRKDRCELMNDGLSFKEACAVIDTREY